MQMVMGLTFQVLSFGCFFLPRLWKMPTPNLKPALNRLSRGLPKGTGGGRRGRCSALQRNGPGRKIVFHGYQQHCHKRFEPARRPEYRPLSRSICGWFEFLFFFLSHLFWFLGVRIHSDSWGCSSDVAGGCNYYSSSSREVDDYMYQHQDFLVLIAAGNSGGMGLYTVEAPATCKNCFSVGASQTTLDGFKSLTAFMDANAEICGGSGSPTCCQTNSCTLNDCCPNYACCSSGYSSQYYGSDNMAEFSSKGTTMSKWQSNQTPDKTSGRIKPDIVSVGETIVSANSDGTSSNSIKATILKTAPFLFIPFTLFFPYQGIPQQTVQASRSALSRLLPTSSSLMPRL